MFRICNRLATKFLNIKDLSKCYSIEVQNNVLDVDKDKKIKILTLEIDVLRQEGRKAPDVTSLKPQHWEQILALETRSARRKFYQFLWQNEKKNESLQIRKDRKKIEIEERKAQEQVDNVENKHISYGLTQNSYFMRIYDSTINHWNNNKLISSMMFEQKLVLDCSYDQHMNPREAQNASKQLMYCFAENRMNDEPFDLHYCNVDLQSPASKHLANYIPKMLDDDFPMNIHQESFLDVFDKNRLVYLTPHCQNDLVEYCHDDIYIVGAMVDKVKNDPLSLAKAKKMGLRMARLPLDRYLQWGAGSGKSLTLNQMVNILLEMKKYGDWERALKFVPRRKLNDNRNYNRNDDRNDFRSMNRERYQQNSDRNDNQRDYNDKRIPNYSKERKHYEKFKFDMNSWGSTNSNRKDVKS
ncbi:unnamed protein product [Diamesa hyperborea]